LIYILDTGFKDEGTDKVTIATPLVGKGEHGHNIMKVVRKINPMDEIVLFDLGNKPEYSDIINCLNKIKSRKKPGCICMSLTMFYDKEVERVMISMGDDFPFIVSAGNAGANMDELMPCGKDYAITVGSLNKSGVIASHNNKGNVDIYAPGTNINVNNTKVSGTSIAMAFAAGYISLHGDIKESQDYIHEDFELLVTENY
jgi:hypothetical protein